MQGLITLSLYNQSLLQPYEHDRHGGGIHRDKTGAPFQYETENGKPLTSGESEEVEHDGFGLGVHGD